MKKRRLLTKLLLAAGYWGFWTWWTAAAAFCIAIATAAANGRGNGRIMGTALARAEKGPASIGDYV